ncbi:hypothetical protein JCM18237_03670 [Halorubrum luteum]
MIPEWFPSLILFTMPASIVGYAVGRVHIRHLAFHGGESKYPDPIPETVEAYRELHYVEELQRTSFGAMLVVLVTANLALSAATVGMIVGYFGVGYYFATKVIRGLAGVDGADEPQIFDTDGATRTQTPDGTSPEATEAVDDASRNESELVEDSSEGADDTVDDP